MNGTLANHGVHLTTLVSCKDARDPIPSYDACISSLRNKIANQTSEFAHKNVVIAFRKIGDWAGIDILQAALGVVESGVRSPFRWLFDYRCDFSLLCSLIVWIRHPVVFSRYAEVI
jgi:hypothetical protein